MRTIARGFVRAVIVGAGVGGALAFAGWQWRTVLAALAILWALDLIIAGSVEQGILAAHKNQVK